MSRRCNCVKDPIVRHPLYRCVVGMVVLVCILIVDTRFADAQLRILRSRRGPSRPSTSAAPLTVPCICLLFPVYNLGHGSYIYYAEQNEHCGSPENCTDPLAVYHAAGANQSPQDCETGVPKPCINAGMAAFAGPAVVKLDNPKPSSLSDADADLAPGSPRPALYHEDIKFVTPKGATIHARVFLFSGAPGAGLSPRPVGFGCEIDDDPATKDVDVGHPKNHVNTEGLFPNLYECKLGSVTFLVITAH